MDNLQDSEEPRRESKSSVGINFFIDFRLNNGTHLDTCINSRKRLPTSKGFCGGCVKEIKCLRDIYQLNTQIDPDRQLLEKSPQDVHRADLPTSILEALQTAQHDLQALVAAGGSVRRIGSDVVDFKDLDSEEVDILAFTEEMKCLQTDKSQVFMGSSSIAALVKQAIELKGAFTGKPFNLPNYHLHQTQSSKEFAVRLIQPLKPCKSETYPASIL
jgi:hypothetical protein